MSENRPISSPGDIDLYRHGIIEAHAGTGKTYTIVKLVIRILEQKNGSDGSFFQLKEILLVTYTEKAAGELKKRILDGISERIKELRSQKPDENLITHLENSLNNMHEALIGTIHGVCLRLLQTWPFETGVHFNTQITDDEEGIQGQLRESMRTEWQDESTCIPQAMRALEQCGVKLEQKHFNLICKIALALINDEGLSIDIQSDGELSSIRDIIEKVNKDYSKIKNEEKSLALLLQKYCGELSDLRDSGKLEADRQELICKLIRRFEKMISTGVYDTKYLLNPQKYGNKGIYTKASRKNIEGYAAVIDETCEEITNHPYIHETERFNNLKSQLLLSLAGEAGLLLAKRYDTYKKQNGLISYNDMLQFMAQALYTKNSVTLKNLRLQLRYGIIDEFQDTSVLQRKIFKKIFLDEDNLTKNGAKMFIVGDPKQSIYSFQNADIQSYIAAKKTITALGGSVYSLIDNYRSLPEVIRGYNAILSPKNTSECNNGEDWFLFGNSGGAFSITYPTDENRGACARAPQRTETPQYPAIQIISSTNKRDMKAVQVISAPDTKTDERKYLAAAVCNAIKNLKGKTVSVPDGLKWKNLTLDYKDFAIIVETHALAQPFIDELRINCIPCVKYKQTGVFNSAMARDLQAVLTGIIKNEDNSASVSAMLTHFFNAAPHLINTQQDLTPCGTHKYSSEELCCAAHSFQYWNFLSEKQLWAQLFKSIIEKTKIRQRLILLTDGERHLADLRQVTDYCIERLYSKNCGLPELTDHLERLYTNEESAGGDKNIHTLSTEKSSVRILTMHAAKGLEFPVVFVVNSEKKELPRGPNFLLWNDDAKKQRKLTPYLSNPKENPQLSLAVDNYALAQKQERRRLLYVAITRPQVMLFVVMRNTEKERELSPHLKELLNSQNPYIELFNEEQFSLSGSSNKNIGELNTAETPSIAPKKIPELLLKPYITLQTSYSQLSRNLSSFRDIDRSEEYGAEDTAAENIRGKLPGSRAVGDALHRMIEELLSVSDLRAALRDEKRLADITCKYLKRGGVLNLASAQECEEAVKEASQYINSALSAPLTLTCGAKIAIADIPKRDRIPEMEFLLSFPPNWIRGFMDLVFRVKNENHPPHPYRYYIVDWKSDNLKNFNRETINEHCISGHYDLQAKIYCLALDKYLKGILAQRYNPLQNLGGSIHLFLRGFNSDSSGETGENLWIKPASPTEDENELRSLFLH
ncbi:MAG: UvrD-helicase domain-containing protein [Chitinispirillales bacterium]|jgi:exodeoxyribonuclease V beta subunit|nr:UvrD-helicase domain-containing protein [Chitinispirillales bacterium]